MKQVLLLMCAFALSMTCFEVDAQVKTPAPSPSASVTQSVGLSEVTIEYSRPSMKGRTIFGDLVPFDEMWRTGANGSTDITLSDDAMIGGNEVKAGKYALYTKPGKDEWKVMLYSDADIWGTPGEKFDESKVVASFTVKSESLPFSVESFTIGTNNIKSSSVDVMMYWENTIVSFPLTFQTDKMVEATIEKTMAGPAANDYFSAARYYMDSGKDLATAHKWVSKAVELRDNAFWMYRVKSQIEAKMGKKEMAIETAKKSMELAEKAGNKQYVKYNMEAIKEWSM